MKKKPNRRRAQRPDYQTLESRNVLSANPIISLDGGTLTIDGSSGDDTVFVRIANGEVQARYQTNGGEFQTESFRESEVTDFRFNGNDGDDHIVNRTELPLLAYGNRGNDRLIGGRGNDELHGGPGNDVLNGFIGDDSLHGDYGNDILSGWHGNDELYGWFGDDVILGGTGDDYISGYFGNDWADAGDGDDVLRGHEGNDHLIGGNGNDELYGWEGHDHLYGGEGDDYISGYHGSDFIAGAGGDDILKGHEGVDRIFGGDGDDLLYGWKGNDLLNGMAGNDEIWGGDGDDNLRGEDGNDILHGDRGNDWIHGGDGNDVLFGFFGNDRLVGGSGHDILCGGFGNDSYAEIEEGDTGYDPDSLFQSGGDLATDQLLNESAAEELESFIGQLSDRAEEVSESVDLVNDLELDLNSDVFADQLDGDRSGFEFNRLNDFFSQERNSGGFIVTYTYTVNENSFTGDSSQAFVIDSGYTGDGEIINVFLNSFNGPTHRSADGSFDIGNTESGFRPDLQIGDTFEVGFHIYGAGFSADQFDVVLIEANA